MIKPKKLCYNTHLSSLPKIPPMLKHLTINAKADSAASNHYWALRDSLILDDVTEDSQGTTVTLPDKSHISSVKKGHLPIPSLSKAAKETKIFKDLNHSLISLEQSCNDDYTVVLT